MDERKQFIAAFIAQLRQMYAVQKTLMEAMDKMAKKGTVFEEADFAGANFTKADFEAATTALGMVLTSVPDETSALLYKVLPLEVGR